MLSLFNAASASFSFSCKASDAHHHFKDLLLVLGNLGLGLSNLAEQRLVLVVVLDAGGLAAELCDLVVQRPDLLFMQPFAGLGRLDGSPWRSSTRLRAEASCASIFFSFFGSSASSASSVASS